jgi:hypothetical protein
MSIRSASKSLRPPRRMNVTYDHAPLSSTTVALHSESACRRDPDTLVFDDEVACGYIVEYNAKCDALIPDHYESLDRFGMPMTPIALEGDLSEPTSSSPVLPRSRSHLTTSCDVIDLDSPEAIAPVRGTLHRDGPFYERVARLADDIVVVIDDDSSSGG